MSTRYKICTFFLMLCTGNALLGMENNIDLLAQLKKVTPSEWYDRFDLDNLLQVYQNIVDSNDNGLQKAADIHLLKHISCLDKKQLTALSNQATESNSILLDAIKTALPTAGEGSDRSANDRFRVKVLCTALLDQRLNNVGIQKLPITLIELINDRLEDDREHLPRAATAEMLKLMCSTLITLQIQTSYWTLDKLRSAVHVNVTLNRESDHTWTVAQQFTEYFHGRLAEQNTRVQPFTAQEVGLLKSLFTGIERAGIDQNSEQITQEALNLQEVLRCADQAYNSDMQIITQQLDNLTQGPATVPQVNQAFDLVQQAWFRCHSPDSNEWKVIQFYIYRLFIHLIDPNRTQEMTEFCQQYNVIVERMKVDTAFHLLGTNHSLIYERYRNEITDINNNAANNRTGYAQLRAEVIATINSSTHFNSSPGTRITTIPKYRPTERDNDIFAQEANSHVTTLLQQFSTGNNNRWRTLTALQNSAETLNAERILQTTIVPQLFYSHQTTNITEILIQEWATNQTINQDDYTSYLNIARSYNFLGCYFFIKLMQAVNSGRLTLAASTTQHDANRPLDRWQVLNDLTTLLSTNRLASFTFNNAATQTAMRFAQSDANTIALLHNSRRHLPDWQTALNRLQTTDSALYHTFANVDRNQTPNNPENPELPHDDNPSENDNPQIDTSMSPAQKIMLTGGAGFVIAGFVWAYNKWVNKKKKTKQPQSILA